MTHSMKTTISTLAIALSLSCMATLANADVEMHTVVDTSDKEVSIPVNPKRIAIAADRAFTEPFVAAGIMPIAVASQHEFAPYLVTALESADELVDLGHHREIDIEALINAKPDLIVMRNISKYGSPELYEKAVNIAPVVQLDSTVGIRELIDDIGDIMGDDVENKLNDHLDQSVAAMASAVADPSALKISHGSIYSGELSLFTDNSNLASQLIKEAGYSRPDAQTADTDVIYNNSTKFGLEQLHQLDGDILFLNQIGSDDEVKDMLASNLWATLSVVQNDRVITSDWRYWNQGGPLAAELIAKDFIAGIKAAGLDK